MHEFEEWLRADGWQIVPTKGIWEVLRATKPGKKPLIIFTRIDGESEHLTVQDGHAAIIRRFIKEARPSHCMACGKVITQATMNYAESV